MNKSTETSSLPSSHNFAYPISFSHQINMENQVVSDENQYFYEALSSFTYDNCDINNVNNQYSTINPNCTTTSIIPLNFQDNEQFNFLTAMIHDDNEKVVSTHHQDHLFEEQELTEKTRSTSPINKPSSVHNKGVTISSVTGRPLYPRQRHTGNTRCNNCNIDHTPMWRKGLQGEILCNKCGLYLTRHGKVRPLNLQEAEDVVSSCASPQEKPVTASQPKRRRSKASTETIPKERSEKKEKKRSESKPKRVMDSTETKAKKKVKSNPEDISSPILNAIFASNHACKISPTQTVSNQLITSPTNSYWNVVNDSPVNPAIFSSSNNVTSQPPIMIKTEQPQHQCNMPNDWILNQLNLSPCAQPTVMPKQAWPQSYTVQQSVPNTVIYSSENEYPYQYQTWNNCFTNQSSPAVQSGDQIFNNFLYSTANNEHVIQSHSFNPSDVFTLKLDQHEFMSELLSDYHFIQ